jgi:hypothetical protein
VRGSGSSTQSWGPAGPEGEEPYGWGSRWGVDPVWSLVLWPEGQGSWRGVDPVNPHRAETQKGLSGGSSRGRDPGMVWICLRAEVWGS